MTPLNYQVSSHTGIIIGLPTLGRPVSFDWSFAFKAMGPPINYNLIHSVVVGRPIDEARNLIAEEAIKQNSKYLFFLGDDVICPPHTLKQLIFRMEQDKDLGVVGGIYCSKSDPPAPLLFRGNGHGSYWDWKLGEYFTVTGIGMDATLIRVEMLKQLPKPWFKTSNTDNFLDGINSAEQWTEDLFFCKNVLENTSYKIFADASVLCDHVDVFSGKKYNIPADSLPLRKAAIVKGRKKVLDIGFGGIKRDFGEDYELITTDIREETCPDYRCDVRQLPFDDKQFDVVFSSHVLEHIPRAEFSATLTEWLRVIKEDGEFHLIVPNIMWAAREIIAQEGIPTNDILNVFYGAQSNPYDFHYNAMTEARISQELVQNGFEVKSIKNEYYNMIVIAKRASAKMELVKSTSA